MDVEVVSQQPQIVGILSLHVLEEICFVDDIVVVVAGHEVDLGLSCSEREVIVVGLQRAGNDSEGEGAAEDACLVHLALVLDVVGKLSGGELEVGHHGFHGG